MGYNYDHYHMDDNGYKNQDEVEKAYNNGHLEKLSNGNYWDRETDEEFYSNGEKKD